MTIVLLVTIGLIAAWLLTQSPDLQRIAFVRSPYVAMITALPSCVGLNNPPRHSTVRYGDYLLDRLNRNYDYRKKAS